MPEIGLTDADHFIEKEERLVLALLSFLTGCLFGGVAGSALCWIFWN